MVLPVEYNRAMPKRKEPSRPDFAAYAISMSQDESKKPGRANPISTSFLQQCVELFERHEGTSFWVPAKVRPLVTATIREPAHRCCRQRVDLQGPQPVGAFEQIARSIFEYHAQAQTYRPEVSLFGCVVIRRYISLCMQISGAEWWVQVRECTDSTASKPIGFHWDKDEELLDADGVNVHPYVSTVTYLTHHGAPTIVLDQHAPRNANDTEMMYDGHHMKRLWSVRPTLNPPASSPPSLNPLWLRSRRVSPAILSGAVSPNRANTSFSMGGSEQCTASVQNPAPT